MGDPGILKLTSAVLEMNKTLTRIEEHLGKLSRECQSIGLVAGNLQSIEKAVRTTR